MSRIKAPANLPDLVKSVFSKARSDGDLFYFPTQVAILQVNNIPFQLRFSPALANKPKAPPSHDTSNNKKPFNPFLDPPAALRVSNLGSGHILVLNKFAVVPEHFILSTNEFKPQTHVLEPADLEATLACIEAYEDARRCDEDASGGDGLYAFFNCGEHSGASQPHRHIQLLPIARMKDGLTNDDDEAWSVLADQLTVGSGTDENSSKKKKKEAPFLTFSEEITLEMSGEQLYAVYLRLYRRACRAMAVYTGQGNGAAHDDAPAEGQARISYNLAMTKSTLVVCPRVKEGANITSPDGGVVLGALALNGTVLAGTALVKSEAEWAALRRDPEILLSVLKKIGIPSQGLDGDAERL